MDIKLVICIKSHYVAVNNYFSDCDNEKNKIWHRQFGHLNYLRKLTKNNNSNIIK